LSDGTFYLAKKRKKGDFLQFKKSQLSPRHFILITQGAKMGPILSKATLHFYYMDKDAAFTGKVKFCEEQLESKSI